MKNNAMAIYNLIGRKNMIQEKLRKRSGDLNDVTLSNTDRIRNEIIIKCLQIELSQLENQT